MTRALSPSARRTAALRARRHVLAMRRDAVLRELAEIDASLATLPARADDAELPAACAPRPARHVPLVPAGSLLKRLGRRTAALTPERVPDELYLSLNAKTGSSVNVAIAGSCEPTRACAEYCYGMVGPVATDGPLGRQADNLALLRSLADAPQARVDAVARMLGERAFASGRDWLRWHGVGDLLPGTARVVNALASTHPGLAQWVVTRKPHEAAVLDDVPQVRLLLSLDETTPDGRRAALLALRGRFRRAAVRVAWVRRAAAPASVLVPPEVDVVFNFHRGQHREAFAGIDADARTCHATEPGGGHEGACDPCRRCFAPRKG